MKGSHVKLIVTGVGVEGWEFGKTAGVTVTSAVVTGGFAGRLVRQRASQSRPQLSQV